MLELDHIDAAKQMVLAGLGVALLPTTAVANELRDGTLRRIDLVGSPPIERRIAMSFTWLLARIRSRLIRLTAPIARRNSALPCTNKRIGRIERT